MAADTEPFVEEVEAPSMGLGKLAAVRGVPWSLERTARGKASKGTVVMVDMWY